jgi:V8-like Glu-specific endopeptidase
MTRISSFTTCRRSVWAASLLTFLTVQVSCASNMVNHVVQKAMPSVVQIQILDDKGSEVASGSGYVVRSNGLIATNYHVIENATHAIAVLSDGHVVRVLGVRYANKARDFAILQVDATSLPPATLGNSDNLQVGDDVVAIGEPLGVFPKTVSAGIVSSIREMDGAKWIQHTAAISHGNSGGPLLNSRGQVVGMNTLSTDKGQNLNFAVPINYVKAALDHLPAQVTSLTELASAQQTMDRQQTADRIRQLFSTYEDPDGLFRLALPKAWQIQRTVSRDEQGNTEVVFTASDPEAGPAKTGTPLSAGIRIRIVIPAQGKVWSEEAKAMWVKQNFAYVANSHSELKAGKPKAVSCGGREGIEVLTLGIPKQGSAPQMGSLILIPSGDLLASVEIAVPANQANAFNIIRAMFNQSFELVNS